MRLLLFGMAPVPDTHMVQRTIATAKVPAVFKNAFANFRMPEFAPALVVA